jgi:nitrite reductase (NO-forming)
MPTRQLQRPPEDRSDPSPTTPAEGGSMPRHRDTSTSAPPPRVVVESVSSGRLLALLVAVVGLSILTSLWIGTRDDTATPTEAAVEAAPGAEQAAAGTTASTTTDPLAADDVLPDLVPRAQLAPAPDAEVNVAVAPQMPPAVERTTPAIVDVAFEVVEHVATIDPGTGTQFETWGYRIVDGDDGVVVGTPGPVIRARVGDVLRFTITNPAGNQHPHNVDFHAVTGQGGGAEATTVAPGESTTIEARMLYPGFFMYHCAYGDVPSHISHGMYGGILVEPATPLPASDHEWYVVQSEYYTSGDPSGVVVEDRAALSAEAPTHVVFNGAVGAIAGDNALQMAVGERARLYFVNAGLNLTSNFHPIGSHWDRVYQEAALLNQPLRGSQTTLVPAGGGTVVELVGQVPQTVLLVDHALVRAFDKGAVGHVVITGDANPEIFDDAPGDLPDAPPAPAGDVTTGDATSSAGRAGESAPGDGEQYAVAIEAGSSAFRDVAPDDYSTGALGGYSVDVLEVRVGDTVTWTNEDTMAHTVTAADGSFDSGLVLPGDTWSHTFTEVGRAGYFCTPHPWMRGAVVVTA